MTIDKKFDEFWESLTLNERDILYDLMHLRLLKGQVISTISNRAVKQKIIEVIDDCISQLKSA